MVTYSMQPRRWLAALILGGLVASSTPLVAAPALSQAQRQQLSTATDHGRIDEGAFYPLLRNAAKWDPTDDRGAQVPDYGALNKHPAKHRGQVCLIEGTFVRQRAHALARANPKVWGKSLIRWAVKTSSDPHDIRVIFFVDPDQSMIGHAPKAGTKIRVPARFYKIWTQQQAGQSVSFLTFVAAGASPKQAPGRFVSSPTNNGGRSAIFPATSTSVLALVFAGILAFGFVLYYLKRLNRQPYVPPSKRRDADPRHRPETEGEDEDEHDDESIEYRDDLPENPAEAMTVLQTEHDEDQVPDSSQNQRDPADALDDSQNDAEK